MDSAVIFKGGVHRTSADCCPNLDIWQNWCFKVSNSMESWIHIELLIVGGHCRIKGVQADRCPKNRVYKWIQSSAVKLLKNSGGRRNKNICILQISACKNVKYYCQNIYAICKIILYHIVFTRISVKFKTFAKIYVPCVK